MFRSLLAVAASTLVVVAGVAFAKSDEPVHCVKLARTWDAAVDEAKTLNLPLVIHHHGFYCPPCWGMHQSVMCNDKYIDFAAENTVEVLALQDLEKGIEKDEKRAGEYDAKDADGNAVKYMLEFPGLTRDEVLALHRSKASSYNDTGGIPFTVVVNPHTLEEMKRYKGGGHSYKTIIEGVTEQRSVLNQSYGASLSRSKLEKTLEQVGDITSGLEKSGVVKSMTAYRKLESSVAKEPDALKAKLAPALEAIVAAATKDLDSAETALDAGDAGTAKKLLRGLAKALDGTDLAERAKQLEARTKE